MASYVFEVETRSGRTSTVEIGRLPFAIGRDRSNDLVLLDPSVSRRHAFVHDAGDGPVITDAGSRNGIRVDGQPVQTARLLEGSVVRVGKIELRFSTRGIAIPVSSPGDVEYFPEADERDPVRRLSEHLEGLATTVELETTVDQPRVHLERLLRILLEAPLPQAYERILAALEGALEFDRSSIILFEDGDPDRTRVATRRDRTRAESPEALISREVLRRVARSRESVIVTQGIDGYKPTESFIASGAESALCVPFVEAGVVTGVLYLDRLAPARSFRREDIEALVPVALLVALKIQNVRLFTQYLEAQLAQRELEIAERVQHGLLPEEPPHVPGYAVAGWSAPCHQVGGDFFDHYFDRAGDLVLVVGDVTGKGLGAALYMAGVLSTVRAHARDGLSPEDILARLDEYVVRTFQKDHFLTVILGAIRPETGSLRYVNAGHTAPAVITPGGDVVELGGSDPALNVIRRHEFAVRERVLRPGELLVLYTDGLVEARNDDGEEFGRRRLFDTVVRCRRLELDRLRSEVLEEIDEFTGGRAPSDDCTLLLVRRQPT